MSSDQLNRHRRFDTVKSKIPIGAFRADLLEQFGRRDSKRISGVIEEHNKDVCQKLVDVAKPFGVTKDKTNTSVCLPTKRNGPKRIILKFVRRQTKHLIMGKKKKLREMGQRLFIDDVTPQRGKVMYLNRQNEEIASVTNLKEKIIVYLKSSDKLVLNSLFEFCIWEGALFDLY